MSLQDFINIARNPMDDSQTNAFAIVQHLGTQSTADESFNPLLPQRLHLSKYIFLHDIDLSTCCGIRPFFRIMMISSTNRAQALRGREKPE